MMPTPPPVSSIQQNHNRPPYTSSQWGGAGTYKENIHKLLAGALPPPTPYNLPCLNPTPQWQINIELIAAFLVGIAVAYLLSIFKFLRK